MSYTAYANYSIFFTEQADYDFAIAAVGGNATTGGVFEGSPESAAAFFDVPFPSGAIGTVPKGFIFYFPFTPGAEIRHPGATGIFLDSAIDSFNVPGQNGNPPGSFGLGQGMILKWSGSIIMSNGVVNDSDDPTPIPRRRWIGGIANTPLMEGEVTFAGGTGVACRPSNRCMGEMGLAVRGQNSANWTRNVNAYIPGFVTRSSWERFYIRIRRVGTSINGIWHGHNSVGALTGVGMRITAGLAQLEVITISSINAQVIVGTIPMTIDEFARIDILLIFPASAPDSGSIRVYKNGELVVSFADGSGGPLDSVGFHTQSEFGRPFQVGGTDNEIEYDLCDWINADIPNKLGIESLDSIDWHLGSHIVAHSCDSVVAANHTPAGAGLLVNQGRYGANLQLNSFLFSTVANALISGLTNLQDVEDNQPTYTGLTIGPVSAVIGVFSNNNSSTDGQLGYSVAGGAPVMVTINEVIAAGGSYNSMMYNPSGMILPAPIAPLVIRYTKSNDANGAAVTGLTVSVEYIGVYGPEDNPDMQLAFPMDFLHNCRYANTPWGLIGKTPDAPVYAVGGTYVGNGTAQTINLPAPCHFLMVRSASAALGWYLFGSGVNGSPGGSERVVPNFPSFLGADPITGQVFFTVTGTDASVNQSGITYQYTAFCDPGMRFNYCGAYSLNPNPGTPRTLQLADTSFVSEWGFFQKQTLSTTITVNTRTKGPGNAVNQGQELDGGLLNNFASFGVGTITPSSEAMDSTAAQTNYSLWRAQDPNCGFTMMQIHTYIGNGAGGTRVINLPNLSGRFPLFVMVQPVSSNPAFIRDASHTGANSANAHTFATSTTAIVAGGIDTISVGTTLNANLVVYNVFVICGSDISWANGTFFPPNCLPPETPWEDPPLDPPEIAVQGDGGVALDGQVSLTLLRDISGIYTLIPGKTNDTLYDRQTGVANVDVKIPNPNFKTGYIGG